MPNVAQQLLQLLCRFSISRHVFVALALAALDAFATTNLAYLANPLRTAGTIMAAFIAFYLVMSIPLFTTIDVLVA